MKRYKVQVNQISSSITGIFQHCIVHFRGLPKLLERREIFTQERTRKNVWRRRRDVRATLNRASFDSNVTIFYAHVRLDYIFIP